MFCLNNYKLLQNTALGNSYQVTYYILVGISPICAMCYIRALQICLKKGNGGAICVRSVSANNNQKPMRNLMQKS